MVDSGASLDRSESASTEHNEVEVPSISISMKAIESNYNVPSNFP